MGAPMQVVFDCANPARLAEFWAGALGYVVQPPPDGFESWDDFLASVGIPEDSWNDRSAVIDPDGTGPRVFFQKVPEPKTVKNRVHLDVSASGGPDTPAYERRSRIRGKVASLIDAGATEVREMGARTGDEYWVVLQDPEGNEFCVQ